MIDGGASTVQQPTDTARRDDMVFVPGGTFLMGSDRFYREERPARPASVEAFWIDRTPVTNAEFARFVEATDYVTFSERAPTAQMYPDAAPEFLVPGSLVFVKPKGAVSLRDYRAWWTYMPGASWRYPNGPDSSIATKDNHPVVHVTHDDARATQNGPARICRRKPNGSLPRAAGLRLRFIHGAMKPGPTGG